MGIVGTLGLFGSVVVHELFHSLGAAGSLADEWTVYFGGVAHMGGEPAEPPESSFLSGHTRDVH